MLYILRSENAIENFTIFFLSHRKFTPLFYDWKAEIGCFWNQTFCFKRIFCSDCFFYAVENKYFWFRHPAKHIRAETASSIFIHRTISFWYLGRKYLKILLLSCVYICNKPMYLIFVNIFVNIYVILLFIFFFKFWIIFFMHLFVLFPRFFVCFNYFFRKILIYSWVYIYTWMFMAFSFLLRWLTFPIHI